MKIYTRTGDKGETGLFGGGRVPKAHIRVESYGGIDELNAALGVAAVAVGDEEIRARILRVQQDLFSLGASLAIARSEPGTPGPSLPPVPEARIGEMEEWIDSATEETPPLRSFILPGGTAGAAALHVARTVCRRAERAVVRLGQQEPVAPGILTYLNRLSDLLFALARLENLRERVPDVLWEKDKE